MLCDEVLMKLWLTLLMSAVSLLAQPQPYIQPSGTRIILVIPETSETWSLYYSSQVHTNWTLFLSKHSLEPFEKTEIDLGLGDARQFWHVGPLTNSPAPYNPYESGVRALISPGITNFVTYPPPIPVNKPSNPYE